MDFLRLLRTEAALNPRRLMMMAVVAGISNAGVLALVNTAAATKKGDSAGWRLALLFIVVVALYTVAQRYVMLGAAREVERIIHRIRVRLIEAVRHCELSEIEQIGRTRIFSCVSKEIQTIAQCGNIIGIVGQMVVLLAFATIYLMLLSMTSFLLAVAFMSVAIVLYFARTERMNRALQQASVAEYGLYDLLTGVLDGLKEIKLNSRRSQALADDVIEASLDAAEARVKAQSEYGANFVFTQNVFFLLLGTMVFIVPALSDTEPDTLVKTVTAVLFLFAPISGVVSSVPVFASANASAASIMQLERLLNRAGATVAPAERIDRPAFEYIELDNALFRFGDGTSEDSFQAGPFNLTLRAGETVFISGGNGSGKSTFLRLLTSLYRPDRGEVLVDGHVVNDTNVESYRSLFAAVFSDYHLMKRLYGIAAGASEEVPELLKNFEIAEKTGLEGDAFTSVDLSAGQRKRLALIVALLERRPILVLDEWAADQDPVFRGKFYTELLTEIKARGITVIAVSHDDRYYHTADRRLHMEDGRIVSDTRVTVDV
jgi:putative ATP-binding cassette transporter